MNQLPKLDRQIQYEILFDKSQAYSLIKDRFKEILTNIEEPHLSTSYSIISILVQRKKRISVNAIFEMLAERDTPNLSAEHLMDTIVLLAQRNILGTQRDAYNRLYITSNYILPEKDYELLEQYQYKIPLLLPPTPLNTHNNNRGDGYYKFNNTSLILNNHHTLDIDHKVLERANTFPYTLNISLIKNIPNKWDSEKLETQENFNRFIRGSFKVCAILTSNTEDFYFTHKYDKRGRIYTCGYHLNPQGNDYQKAQLECANKEIIDETIHFFGDNHNE